MRKKAWSWLAVSGLFISFNSPAQTIDGIFGGYVVGTGSGMIGTLDASSVAAGTPIFGTFSYDAQTFQTGTPNGEGGLNGNGYWRTTGATDPVVITETVAGSTFTVLGTVQSVLSVYSLPGQDPNNHFYLEAMNYGSSIQGFSGAIDLNLSNYLGAPFASDLNNPGSVALADQSAFGVNDVDTLQSLSTNGNNTGSLYFSISHAWAGPTTLQAPEIDPASAASGLTLLLGVLAISRGRHEKQKVFA